eukprot:scaffold856_cov326-Pavlova_lutheri.AAC.7
MHRCIDRRSSSTHFDVMMAHDGGRNVACDASAWRQKYELVRDIDAGTFGVAKLMRVRDTGELVASKFIERGEKITANVAREIVNHRSLHHPNIVRFREVFLTETHLGIAMDFASGGEIFNHVKAAKHFNENEARFFFQQLMSGVNYCHQLEIYHRDLKMENVLLHDLPTEAWQSQELRAILNTGIIDGSMTPTVKLCDFGYSKSSLLQSMPKSTVGTISYMCPEILTSSNQVYDGRAVDVWSCGVILFAFLFGWLPFNDPKDVRNMSLTSQKILAVDYTIPDHIPVSSECKDLLARIFVADPTRRITIPEIIAHPWFQHHLRPDVLISLCPQEEETMLIQKQPVEEISAVVLEAMKHPYQMTG